MKEGCVFAAVILFIVLIIPIILVGGHILGWGAAAINTVTREVSPDNLLRKYEWFKDVAAQAEAKIASISAFDQRQKSLIDSYQGKSRSDWPREDREQYNLWETEKAGIKASYNNLAAEYNAQMAKFNWRFCEVGTLPAGAGKPLPREFKPYLEN